MALAGVKSPVIGTDDYQSFIRLLQVIQQGLRFLLPELEFLQEMKQMRLIPPESQNRVDRTAEKVARSVTLLKKNIEKALSYLDYLKRHYQPC